MLQDVVWFCGCCHYGPHSAILYDHCANCWRRRSREANVQRVRFQDYQPRPRQRSDLNSDDLEPTSAEQPSNSAIVDNDDIIESPNINASASIVVLSNKNENSITVESTIVGDSNINDPEVSNPKALPEVTSSSDNSRLTGQPVTGK